MFSGTKTPPVEAPREPVEEEEYYQHKFKSRHLSHIIGFKGDDAEDKMWEMWRKYGATEAESPQQQEARYAGVDPDGPERNPGRSRNKNRNPDIIATASQDYLIRTWDARTFALLQTFEGHLNSVNVVEQYHGKWLISVSDDGSIRLWRLGTEKMGLLDRTIQVDFYGARAMCVLPGHRVCISMVDCLMRIVSVHSGEVLFKVDDHYMVGPYDSYWQKEGCGCVSSLLHLRDNLMVSAADDMTIRFWDIDTMKCFGIHVGHHGYGAEIKSKSAFARRWAPIWCLQHLGGDGTRIASGSYDRTIVIWDVFDVEHVQVVQTLKGPEHHDNSVLHLSLLEDNILCSCGGDFCFKVWDVTTGECLHTVETRGLPMCSHRLNDHCFMIGGGDTTIRVFDWKAGEDLLGERGFYAHDMAIVWAAPVFKSEMEDENATWLEPIMFRQTDPFEMVANYEDGMKFHPNLRKEARDYARYGEWGETFADPAGRFPHYTMDHLLPDE